MFETTGFLLSKVFRKSQDFTKKLGENTVIPTQSTDCLLPIFCQSYRAICLVIDQTFF